MRRIQAILDLRRVQRVVPLFLAGGFLAGCALFFRAPAIELVEIRIVSLGLTSGTAEVVLDVTNEGGREMEIRGFLYELQVQGPEEEEGWTALAEGFFDQELSIPGRETRRVSVPVPFNYSALGVALRSLLSEGEVPYRLRGEAWFGGSSTGLQIPFRAEGVLEP